MSHLKSLEICAGHLQAFLSLGIRHKLDSLERLHLRLCTSEIIEKSLSHVRDLGWTKPPLCLMPALESLIMRIDEEAEGEPEQVESMVKLFGGNDKGTSSTLTSRSRARLAHSLSLSYALSCPICVR